MTHPVSTQLLRAYPSDAARYAWEMTPQPLWVDSPFGPLFAWYHPPRGAPRNRAVLLCDCVGTERMTLHLAYRHAALWLSYNGFPALRIDYAGTGDSSGTPGNGDQLRVWLDSLDVGARALRNLSATDSLAVFGIRFGATLAAAFAARREDVREAMLWGPYPNGERFLRDARALERMSGFNAENQTPSWWREGDVESIGFLFRRETVAAVEALSVVATPPIDAACLFTWDGGTRERRLADAWREGGVDVTFQDMPVMDAELATVHQAVPAPIVLESARWLLERTEEMEAASVAASATRDATTAVIAMDDGCKVVEECVRAGPDAGIFALCTWPHQRPRAAAKTAVVLVSGGNNHRCGINRNYTEWARHWASRGVPVLRMDIRGLGDSPPLRASELNELYRTDTAQDVVHVMDWMEQHHGTRSFVLCGLCAGAFQALHTARNDQRVRGLVLIELLRFYRDEATPLSRGLRLARRGVRRGLSTLGVASEGLLSPLGRWIQRLCERGTSVLVVYRPNEAMYRAFSSELMRRQPAIEATGCFCLTFIPDANHIFSPLWSQERLGAVLDGFILGQDVEPEPQRHDQ